jgi:hypothetical protein
MSGSFAEPLAKEAVENCAGTLEADEMRLERVADFLRVEIPGDRMNVAEVNLEGGSS